MYQSFTGSSRRPRQVNLSGRNSNPFASVGAGATASSQQAIQSAHQDRAQRQQQRAELTAAKTLQKTWRGYSSRKKARDAWRRQWDAAEGAGFYATPDESLISLRLLLLFFNAKQESDIRRLVRYGQKQTETVARSGECVGDAWPMAYLRLESASLAALEILASKREQNIPEANALLRFLAFLISQIPEESRRLSEEYYRVLTLLTQTASHEILNEALSAPLRTFAPKAYEGLVASLLTKPQRSDRLDRLSRNMNGSSLMQAANHVATKVATTTSRRLWLLGNLIYLVDAMHLKLSEHIPTVAPLLASLAGQIDAQTAPLDMDNLSYENSVLAKQQTAPLNKFLHQQILRLVDQDVVRSLLSRTGNDQSRAQLLAGYGLTLLQVFPLRADDIRMWLYLGPSGQHQDMGSPPASSYFWTAACGTYTYKAIFRDSRAVIDLVRPPRPEMASWQPPASSVDHNKLRDEWRVILVFLELYTFVLKIMDDEEFLRGGSGSGSDSGLRNNALPISDVKDLTIFLKNLGFTMYYNSPDLSESDQSSLEGAANLARHFGGSASVEAPILTTPQVKREPYSLAGIPGMSLDYVKGLVTGLLRMIYERDSRRKFLPQGHWLMTSRFDMSNFIQAVVIEEGNRHQIQSQEDEERDPDSDSEIENWTSRRIGTRRFMNIQRTARAQRRASRKRYLEAVAPRLEILQNMPFLIPFETRVEVFRQFVSLDQAKRRGGDADADSWRGRVLSHWPSDPRAELQRHHAKVRRKHEFEDAFDYFYQLGSDLKEPIQITFVDEFDIVEAGIDGGGVTKEFLLSVTSQAFNPQEQLFDTNSQHLLYPRPTSVEEKRAILRASGLADDTSEHRQMVGLLLRQYEFLGRIVGKCLYEGILIDVEFAGFFLIKWALTGGVGSAPMESGYRANINDLRDLDEELYQGLLMLKNYPGNVEDLSLNFTITDTIPQPDGRTKTIERELMPGGQDRAVTSENRLVYISYVSRWRLQAQSARQTNAFLKGLSSIIEPSWLRMFNQSELQTLIGGAASSLDIPDLRRNTEYGGVYVIGNDRQEHPSIQLFWRVMEKMSDAERRKVLKFVTSTPRAPLLGFASLVPRFSIRDSGADENRFPTTSTCVNLLKMPRYQSEAVLRDKLMYAVNSGAGFDLS